MKRRLGMIGSPVGIVVVAAAVVGGFAVWALSRFGPRDIPAHAPDCTQVDWAALNAQGVRFGSFSNSGDRAQQEDEAGVLPRQGDPYPRCIEIFGDKTCNLVGPGIYQVNRPEGPLAIVLEDGQTARLHNTPDQPFRCGLLDVAGGNR
jgi:hypothetical protein